MPQIDLSILNQRQTPAFYADTLANRPAAGFIGRIFVSTNTFELYRDNGTGWDLIGGPGAGTVTGSGAAGQVAFWNAASTITGNNNLFYDAALSHLGINTNVPGTALDVHHDQSTLIQLNQTVATNDTRIGFQNNGTALWRIGNFYNAAANDWGIFDVVGAIQPLTIKKTTGQTFIGPQQTSSGKLVVVQTASDQGLVVLGSIAPSVRLNNGTGLKQAGLGISTAANNFIQGSVDRDFCIFNGSTTAASPMLFGIYDAVATNVQEAARISPARNFLIGTTTDAGQKLQITGTSYFNGNVGLSATIATNKLTVNNVAGGFTTVASISNSSTGSSTTALLLQNSSATESASTGINLDFSGAVNWLGRINTRFVGATGAGNTEMYFSTATGGSLTERMVITNNGDVQVFKTTGTLLEVRATSSGGTAELKLNPINNNNYSIYTSGSTDSLQFLRNATPLMTITSGGNLLIGTTTDNGTKLQINGNATLSATSTPNILITDIGSSRTLLIGNDSLNAFFRTANGNNILFQISGGTTALTIKSTGVVNIANVPTSAAGLVSGDIYRLGSVLNIVP